MTDSDAASTMDLEPTGSSERNVIVAIELSADTTPALVNFSDILEPEVNLLPLIPNDVSDSTDPNTGQCTFNRETKMYNLSVSSIRRLHELFRVGLDILSNLQCGVPLRRLSPPGDEFVAHVDSLLARAEVYDRSKGLDELLKGSQDEANIQKDLPSNPKANRPYRRSNSSGSSVESCTTSPGATTAVPEYFKSTDKDDI